VAVVHVLYNMLYNTVQGPDTPGITPLLVAARMAKPRAWPSAPHAMVSTRVKPAGSLVVVMKEASCCRLSK
jgi:hypothetical protein